METSIFKTEIAAPIQQVWNALSTTEGMNGWLPGIQIESEWQVGSPISFTMYENGEVLMENGEKMVFKGIIITNNENKEIAYSFPKKLMGIEKEQYILDEVNTDTTQVTFIQTCTSEQKAKAQEDDQKQLMVMLKKKMEEKEFQF